MLNTLDDTLTDLTNLADMLPSAKALDSRHLPAIHLHPAVERRMAAARPHLVRLARLQGVAEEGAEDVVQETLLEAWRSLDALRSPERFDAWLDGICRNVCRRWVRSHAAISSHQQPLHTTLGAVASEQADGEHGEQADLPDPQAFDPEEELLTGAASAVPVRSLLSCRALSAFPCDISGPLPRSVAWRYLRRLPPLYSPMCQASVRNVSTERTSQHSRGSSGRPSRQKVPGNSSLNWIAVAGSSDITTASKKALRLVNP